LEIRFELGHLVITATATEALDPSGVLSALHRHARGDWGDLSEDDRLANEEALANGYRLLSVYADRRDTPFWIITEGDRSYTTILLPSDY
jgi:hypothetical protein